MAFHDAVAARETDAPPRMSSIPPHLAAGMIIAEKYELIAKLGSDSMGEAWRARHLILDEDMAMKLVMCMNHEDGRSSGSRFLCEARAAAQRHARRVTRRRVRRSTSIKRGGGQSRT